MRYCDSLTLKLFDEMILITIVKGPISLDLIVWSHEHDFYAWHKNGHNSRFNNINVLTNKCLHLKINESSIAWFILAKNFWLSVCFNFWNDFIVHHLHVPITNASTSTRFSPLATIENKRFRKQARNQNDKTTTNNTTNIEVVHPQLMKHAKTSMYSKHP